MTLEGRVPPRVSSVPTITDGDNCRALAKPAMRDRFIFAIRPFSHRDTVASLTPHASAMSAIVKPSSTLLFFMMSLASINSLPNELVELGGHWRVDSAFLISTESAA